MSDFEVKLAAVALYWRKRHYDSSPEVGFGPTLTDMAFAIAEKADPDSEVFFKKDIDAVVAKYKQMFPKIKR